MQLGDINHFLYHNTIIRHNNKDVNRKVVKNMKEQDRIEKLARELRNKKAQEWRKNNKDKERGYATKV